MSYTVLQLVLCIASPSPSIPEGEAPFQMHKNQLQLGIRCHAIRMIAARRMTKIIAFSTSNIKLVGMYIMQSWRSGE